MVLFSYVSQDRDGKRVTGTVEAQDVQSAHAALQAQELTPEELREISRTTVNPATEAAESERSSSYFPLSDTLRLYAGWLLALYFLVYALGGYQFTGVLPVRLGIVEDLFGSPIILSFSAAAFLYLLLHSLHRKLGGGIPLGLLLAFLGVLAFLAFRVNA